MPLYELGVVLSADLEGEERDAFIDELRQIIASAGGEIAKEDVWGKRNLAYMIDRKREGFYFFWQIQAPGTVIAPLEYKLRISDQALRYLTLNLDRELRRSRKAERIKAAKKKKKPPKAPTTAAPIEAESAAAPEEA